MRINLLLFFSALLILPLPSLKAETPVLTMRLLAPVNESSSIEQLTDSENLELYEYETNSGPTTTGFGLHFIFKNGMGIGYSAIETKYDADIVFADESVVPANSEIGDSLYNESAKIDASFFDVSLTVGENFRTTLGIGFLTNGTASYEITYAEQLGFFSNGFEVDSIDASGSSTFLNFAYRFDWFEIILGVRANVVEYEFEEEVLDEPLRIETQQANLGFGFAI